MSNAMKFQSGVESLGNCQWYVTLFGIELQNYVTVKYNQWHTIFSRFNRTPVDIHTHTSCCFLI